MSIGLLIMESFGWTNSMAEFATRYNIVSPTGSINPTGGRFGNGEMNSVTSLDVPVPSSPTSMASGFSFFVTNPLINNRSIIAIQGVGGSQWYLATDTFGRLVVYFGDGSTILATGTTPIIASSWNWIEFDCVIAPAGGGSVRVWLNDILQCTFTGTTQHQAAAAITNLHWGDGFGGHVFQVSDWYVKSTTGKLGQSRVVILIPASDGTYSQWTPSAAGPHFSLVNNIPPGGDVNYVEDTVASDKDSYNFTQLPYNPNAINAIQTSFYARTTDATARIIKPLLRIGGADVTGAGQSMSSTFLDYIQIFEANPQTTNPWTQVDVDTSEYGVFLVS